MKKLITFLPLFILLITGCQNRHKEDKKLFWLRTDTITFSDATSIGLFQKVRIGGNLFLSAFDYKNCDIVLSGIDSVCTSRIKGGKIFGLDTTEGRIQSYCIYTQDSIFWLYDDILVLTDRKGQVRYKRYMNTLESDSADKYFYGDLGNAFPIYFDPAIRSFFLYRRRIDIENSKSEWGNSSPEVLYNIDDSAFHSVPFFYPDMYRRNYYGDGWEAYRTIADSENIVSYMVSDEVVLYNRYTGSIRKPQMHTDLFLKKVAPFFKTQKDPNDIQQKMDYLLTCPIYMGIFYDTDKKLYYRLAHDGLDPKNKDGTYNAFQNKPLIISVYDSEFNRICDQKMGETFTGNFGYATKIGFNLFKKRIKDKNGNTKVCFDVFALQ